MHIYKTGLSYLQGFKKVDFILSYIIISSSIIYSRSTIIIINKCHHLTDLYKASFNIGNLSFFLFLHVDLDLVNVKLFIVKHHQPHFYHSLSATLSVPVFNTVISIIKDEVNFHKIYLDFISCKIIKSIINLWPLCWKIGQLLSIYMYTFDNFIYSVHDIYYRC